LIVNIVIGLLTNFKITGIQIEFIEMGRIALIDGYQKIAAGEIIERPASVVKELLENALDANADQIFLKIEKSGKHLIEISDNGAGIEENDVGIAFERHTSSKIQSADQLGEIESLGFRGEALFSIAAVSQIELITRPKSQSYAINLHLNAGKQESLDKSGGAIGTTIKVKNLFFNLPVRQKFLKSDKAELGHITDILCRYSLAYPLVHFKLMHNGLNLINSPRYSIKTSEKKTLEKSSGVSPLPPEAYLHAIQTIYGKKISDKMTSISFVDENHSIFGHIGHPDIGRSERGAASLFVNDRLVSNKAIAKVIENAYRDYLMRNRYPFYVLFISVPFSQVDFNVHPTKKIVKFVDEANFFSSLQMVLKKLISQKFQSGYESKVEKSEREQSLITASFSDKSSSQPQQMPNNNRIETKTSPVLSIPKNSQRSLPTNQGSKKVTQSRFKFEQVPKHSKKAENMGTGGRKLPTSEHSVQVNLTSIPIQVKNLPSFQLLNNGIQAGDLYLIFQTDDGLLLIDQHAADERINYEKVKNELSKSKIQIQQLLSPIKFDVALNEVEFVKDAVDKIKNYGIELEHFGGRTFVIRTIPVFIQNITNSSLIVDLCLEILKMGKEQSFSNLKRDLIQYIGCHMSIRAGDDLWDRKKIMKLISTLDQCENPHHCAHGRPTYIKISFKDLEKQFHRR
jgi:DNA mismatch repair protein MutL